MNIEEIKKWWSHPDVSGNFNAVIADSIDFLLAEIDRLTAALATEKARAATHLADQELLVAKERKRVAGEIAEIAERGDVGPHCNLPSTRAICITLAQEIREKYGVEE